MISLSTTQLFCCCYYTGTLIFS